MTNNILKIQTLKTENNTIPLAPFENLLNRQLTIPEYQREYAWEKEHIVDLFKSIKEHYYVLMDLIGKNIDEYKEYCEHEARQDEKKKFTFLGSIVFCVPKKNSADNYIIIDGQQRITTLLTILKFIQLKIQSIKERLEDEKNKLKQNGKRLEDYIKHNESLKTKIENINKIIKSVKITREHNLLGSEETDILNYINGNDISADKKERIETNIEESLEEAFDDNKFLGTTTILESKFFISLIDYILQYILVCWIRIEGKDSDTFSIDLFNIMNSTGEPLTGFEIFKSKMLQKNNSEGKKVDAIREEISKEFKSERKKILKHTGKLILFLAIYRNDYKERNNISDREWKKQKKYIDLIFKENDTHKLKKVCEDFNNVYQFYFNKWLKNNNKKQKAIYKKETGLCFKFLTNIGHDRVLPVLLMFKEAEQKEAIKICTAFSVIWRAFHHGETGGIDTVYLDIASSLKKKVNIKTLKEKLIENLKITIKSKELWIDTLKEVPIYNKHKRVTRFLLLVAANRMTYQNGQLIKTKKSRDILTPATWEEDEQYETIDHMVPQKDSSKLKSVHVLGNLTFLPKKTNSQLKDMDFQSRKVEFKKMITLHEDKYPYLPILKEVCNEHGGSQNDTDKRTERLGEIIWQTLAQDWLGWKD